MRLHKPGPSRTDEAFIALTRAANHSVLWLAAAAVLALAGGRRGRRAAIRGLVAIGVASAVANGPLKFVFRRERPTRRPALIRKPTTYSFPSGHSASAFAFATAASAELPAAAPVLLPLASAVAYSRVRVGVHRIQDVVAGGALGVVCGAAVALASRPRRLAPILPPPPRPSAPQGSPDPGLSRLPRDVVLVTSPNAGSSDGLSGALDELRRGGLSVAGQLEIGEIERLSGMLRAPDGGPRLIIAAGGDGTVGAVADCLAANDSVLGILPLGTSNDFARSLGIPIDPRQAAALLTQGKVARVDLGRLLAPGEPPRHFVHAATAGLNVTFARLATRASVRERFGYLTYLVAAGHAFRERSAFDCELRYRGRTEKLTLTQLSVMNAPAFAGSLGLSVEGSDLDDRLLDVLAFEDMPTHRLLLAATSLLLPGVRPLAGVRALHVSKLHVHTSKPLAVALDGEVMGRLPGDFDVVGDALRVVTPLEFVDV
ncbi:MAG TPA: diacylglycerol kinase family protein [Trebonia sp.]|nr:diacylglycerol kinase family protein [Trebonia sp.]